MFEFLNLDNASKAEKEILHTMLHRDARRGRKEFYKDLKPPFRESEFDQYIDNTATESSDGAGELHESSISETENYNAAITSPPAMEHGIVPTHGSISSNNLSGQGGHQHMRPYYQQGPIPQNPHSGGTGHPISHHPQMPLYHSQLIQTPNGQFYQQFPIIQMQYGPPHPHGLGLPPHMQQQQQPYIPAEGSDPIHQKLHHEVQHPPSGMQNVPKYKSNKTRPRREEMNAVYPSQYYPNVNYPPIYYTTQAVTNMTGTPLIMPSSATPGTVYPTQFTQMYPSAIVADHQQQRSQVNMSLDNEDPMNRVKTPPKPYENNDYRRPEMLLTRDAPAQTNRECPEEPTQSENLNSQTEPNESYAPIVNGDPPSPPSYDVVTEQQEDTKVFDENAKFNESNPKAWSESCESEIVNGSSVGSVVNTCTTHTHTELEQEKPAENLPSKCGPENPKTVTKTWSSTVNGGNLVPAVIHSSPTVESKKEFKSGTEFPQLHTAISSPAPIPVSVSQPVNVKSMSMSWASIASRKTMNPSNGTSNFANVLASSRTSNDESNKDICNDLRTVQINKGETSFLAFNSETGFEDDPIALRLGEYLANYVLNHHTYSLTPRGLSNQSNFCYINATLQALVACPPFVNLFRSLRDILGHKPCKSTPIIQSVYDFIMEFEPITRQSQQRTKKSSEGFYIGASFEASGIRKVLGLLDGATFKVEGRQEDAEEFLSHILNGLHDEMIKVIKWSEAKKQGPSTSAQAILPAKAMPGANTMEEEDDNDQWQVMGPKNKGCMTRKTSLSKSPISEMFVGQMCSALNRANSLKSTTLQPFFTLQLDIQSENVHSVRDALDGISMKEEVTGCISSNGVETEAWKQMSLEVLPTILILHMKRFVFDTTVNTIKKLDKQVNFTVELEIAKELLSINSRGKYTLKQRQYKLFAVVYHDGEEAIKGHYVADTFHPSGGSLWGNFAWIRYDDTTVKGVSEHQIINTKAPRVPYLLYYRRVDTLNLSKKDRS